MPTVSGLDLAAHDVQLPAGQEVTVTFDVAPADVEVVVTTPGASPIWWNADDRPAREDGPACRVIPAGVLAVDRSAVRRTRSASRFVGTVRLYAAAAAVVSVQRGA